MSMGITFEAKKDYVEITVTGVYSIEDACKCLGDGLEFVRKGNILKVLVNTLQVSGKPETIDYYTLGGLMARELTKPSKDGKSAVPKVAFVARAPLLDPQHLTETVARNRGALVKSVENVDEAVQWLAGD